MDVAHSPPTKKNPTGSSKWPLDPGLEVSLRMTTVSCSTGDQKVSVAAVVWDVFVCVCRGVGGVCRSQQVSYSQSVLHWPTAPALAELTMAHSSHSVLTDSIRMPRVYGGQGFD